MCFTISAGNAAAVSPNVIKRVLVSGLITLFVNGNPVFNNGLKVLARKDRHCTILNDSIFDSLILADELFAKSLTKICNLSINQ